MKQAASAHLPIYAMLPAIGQAVQANPAVILQAAPGAGKSTVVPTFLADQPWIAGQKILMLEPRRLAARAVAERMAELQGETVGKRIGYRVRFEAKVSSHTQVEVVTEGILTRMLQRDPALEGVGVVLFDEFHERSLAADLALALCREAQGVLRPDLKLLIMSATMDTAALSALLGGAPVLQSAGRQFPVDVRYMPQDERERLENRMAATIKQAMKEGPGDVLAFLPGAAEIERTATLLAGADAAVHTLYGDLPPQRQRAALLPDAGGRRKIVLATSIAETSLTIEGVRIVVDSGLARVPRFDLKSGLSRLETVPVTVDAADQRAGRAGRLAPGTAYRMWTEGRHHQLLEHRKPEIAEADLAPLVLELAQWGVYEPSTLAWLTPPPLGAVAQARDLLIKLDALDVGGKITARGRQMLELPTHPRLSHMLLEGAAAGLTNLAADLAALLDERDPLPREAGADITLRVEALRRSRDGDGRFGRIAQAAAQWRRVLAAGSEKEGEVSHLGRLIAYAYPERVAKQRASGSDSYKLAGGRGARLADHDPLSANPWLAVAQMDAGLAEGRIHLAAPLDIADLMADAVPVRKVEWDGAAGRLVAAEELRYGTLVLSTKPLRDVPEAEALVALKTAVQTEGLRLLGWEEQHRQWQARVESLRAWNGLTDDRTGLPWPDPSDAALLADMDAWLTPYLAGLRKREDFEKLDTLSLLNAYLPWPLPERLAALAPRMLAVPTGSEIKLEYRGDGAPPILAVRLQEMFGLADTPTVNEGRTPVLLHLLSPGYKPVQVTQDLRSFWNSTYAEVRKELRMRYPRHAWPDDPWMAEAVRGAKRR